MKNLFYLVTSVFLYQAASAEQLVSFALRNSSIPKAIGISNEDDCNIYTYYEGISGQPGRVTSRVFLRSTTRHAVVFDSLSSVEDIARDTSQTLGPSAGGAVGGAFVCSATGPLAAICAYAGGVSGLLYGAGENALEEIEEGSLNDALTNRTSGEYTVKAEHWNAIIRTLDSKKDDCNNK